MNGKTNILPQHTIHFAIIECHDYSYVQLCTVVQHSMDPNTVCLAFQANRCIGKTNVYNSNVMSTSITKVIMLNELDQNQPSIQSCTSRPTGTDVNPISTLYQNFGMAKTNLELVSVSKYHLCVGKGTPTSHVIGAPQLVYSLRLQTYSLLNLAVLLIKRACTKK